MTKQSVTNLLLGMIFGGLLVMAYRVGEILGKLTQILGLMLIK